MEQPTLTAHEEKPAEKAERAPFSRQEQSFGSRLAEYITGLRPDDPRMVERLAEDRLIIRAKYKLPDLDAVGSLSAYERLLKRKAEELGVEIAEKSACGDFFKKSRLGGAYMWSDRKIGADMVKTDKKAYLTSLCILEHELIHALQHEQAPNMPIEQMEYEAYIAGGDMDFLKSNPEAVDTVFTYLIGGSVGYWYKAQSESQRRDIKPVWDSADYFIDNVDGAKP
ncbi:MAG: hypothetical protein KGI69_02040 [Patescibacteria group bacterium]|nr:hypothetical protein [Patescibacteria group bacterium]